MASPSYKFINKLQGKTVLIFGGTSGIGFSVGEASIEFGANVIISGSNQPKLDKTVERLKSSYPDVTDERIATYPCDLADAGSLESNLDALLQKVTSGGSNKIDHVVFTAGDALQVKPFSDIDLETFYKAQTVRLLAPLFLVKLLPKYMHASSESSITFTGGSNTYRPSPGWGVISTIGSALDGLVRGAAVDLAPLRVNVVVPGAIGTELFNGIPPEAQERFANSNLLKKIGKPEDVAEAYLRSMKDTFATGALFTSDGGRLLHG